MRDTEILELLEKADIQYSNELIQLVNGIHTRRVTIYGHPPVDFTDCDENDYDSQSESYRYIDEMKRLAKLKVIRKIFAEAGVEIELTETSVKKEVPYNEINWERKKKGNTHIHIRDDIDRAIVEDVFGNGYTFNGIHYPKISLAKAAAIIYRDDVLNKDRAFLYRKPNTK